MPVEHAQKASITTPRQVQRRLPIGAELQPEGGVHFRVWAPRRGRVDVVFESPAHESVSLNNEGSGYFSASVPEARAGSLYRFRLDDGKTLYPDPASRFQPQGVHGPSEIVDPSAFIWTDSSWPGIGPEGQVLYEMHIGTFTPEGTWDAAAEQLPQLEDLGITCLEVMPVAEFAGNFGWGYDGVDLFAPTRLYGSPDNFRRFVDRAHAIGLAVILDVVYNHLGPDGCYLKEFSDHYFTTKHKNDWGESLNFDDTGAVGTREYFVSNARHWISEYHLDGFRFDATQAILDDSPEHVLAAICRESRAAAGKRKIYLINENEPQHTKLVRPAEKGGYGLDALWNDDFHHSAMVALLGRNEAYFTDYLGRPQEFISSLKWGYLYQGQFYKWQQKRRGTSTFDLPPTAFVNYIQNHDQIANYGHGQRAHHMTSLAEFRAMTALLLLAPQTPMLFMGQEFASTSSFHYFADHNADLSKLIREGRARELAQFDSAATPEMQSCLRDPGTRETFMRCKLDHSERHKGFHARMYALHQDLLRIRREDPVFRRIHRRGDIDGAILGHDSFVIRFFGQNTSDDRLLIINFGTDLHLPIVPEPLLGAPEPMQWHTQWSSEDPRYGGCGSPPLQTHGEDWRLTGESWRIPGRSAVLLKLAPLTTKERSDALRLEKERKKTQDHAAH